MTEALAHSAAFWALPQARSAGITEVPPEPWRTSYAASTVVEFSYSIGDFIPQELWRLVLL
jgi:hypothetical protein